MSKQSNSNIDITISFNEDDINKLWKSACHSFFNRQRERFTIDTNDDEIIDYEDNESFLYYTDTFLESKCLQQYFRKTGYSAHLLYDSVEHCGYCVITDKSFH